MDGQENHTNKSPRENGVRGGKPRIHLYFWAVALLWTLGVGASLCFNLYRTYHRAEESALTQARTAFEKDAVYRRWNSGVGGLYVKVTPRTRPNPYLAGDPARDIAVPGGMTLTKVNPAYMTRLVHELGELRSGVRGHITSTRPIRPENAPDPWERSALVRLEEGPETEVHEVRTIDGERYLRLMSALKTERSCLPCHEGQGYSLGQVRGGISVGVPMKAATDEALSVAAGLGISHFTLWLMGMLIIVLGHRRLVRYIRERDAAELRLERALAELDFRICRVEGEEEAGKRP